MVFRRRRGWDAVRVQREEDKGRGGEAYAAERRRDSIDWSLLVVLTAGINHREIADITHACPGITCMHAWGGGSYFGTREGSPFVIAIPIFALSSRAARVYTVYTN